MVPRREHDPTLTDHLGELATRDDLRRRFRRTVREEVARAVAEVLRQLALSMIGNYLRSLPRRSEYAGWDDLWQDAAENPWDAGAALREDLSVRERSVADTLPLHLAMSPACGRRGGFVRTRQPLPALGIGLGVGLAAFAGD